MRSRRILITGSRDWDGEYAIAKALHDVWVGWGQPADAVLVSGHCPDGADAIAETVWRRQRFEVEEHPADWKAHGKRAGFVRNAEMVDLGADICLAFLNPCTKPGCSRPRPHDSHGGSMTADLAEQAGIPVRRIRP